MNTYVLVWQLLAEFLLGWEMLRTNVANNIKTNILFLIRLFSESRVVNETTWKKWHGRTGHRCQHNTAHAFCMLDNWSYKYTLRIFNTFRSKTTKCRTYSKNLETAVQPISIKVSAVLCAASSLQAGERIVFRHMKYHIHLLVIGLCIPLTKPVNSRNTTDIYLIVLV